MTVDGPTKAKETNSGKWVTHPIIANTLKFAVMATPTVASFASTHILTRNLPARETNLPIALWWLMVITVGLVVLVGTDRIMRRALPLVALFRLSLIFPDKAPSRFSIAIRTGTTKQLQRQIEEIKHKGLPTDATQHAELMLQMVAALSVHDRLTRGHCERVRAYTDMISEEMGLNELDAAKLRWAALLHDVGKLFVPSEILNKEGKPTQEEWEILKSHTWQGDKLIGPLKPWLGEWAAAVGSHHERWDGGGYPNGLAGENIHIGARIVSVADTFDVITSKRSYKAAIPADKARAEIARCAGGQFDPKVARAFLNIGLGRLRFAIGPLAWLANIPAAGQAAVAPVASPMATAAVAIAATSAAVVTGNAQAVLNHETQPDTLAFVDESDEVASPPPPTTVPTPTTQPAPTQPPTTPAPAAPSPVAPRVDDVRLDLNEDGQATATISVEAGTSPATLSITERGSLGSATLSNVSFAAGEDDSSELRYVGNPNQSGFETLTYEVCDANDRCDSGWANVTIKAVNDAPRVRALPDQSFRGGDTVSIVPSVDDVEGDAVTFAATGLPRGVEIDAESGAISGVITPGADPAEHVVTVSVSDSGSPSRTSTVSFSIRVVAADHPVAMPAFEWTNEDEAMPITLQAMSFDGDLTFSILAPPTNGTLSQIEKPTPAELATETRVSATTTYTPDANLYGDDSFVFEICDRMGRCDTSTANLTVEPVNDPPTIDTIGTVTASVLESLSIPLSTSDIDSGSVTITATGLPDGLSVDAASSRIAGTVPNGLAGSRVEVHVTATDNATPPASTTTSFELALDQAAPVPMVVVRTINEDTQSTVAVAAQTESGNLTYSIPAGQTYQGTARFTDPTTTTAADGWRQSVSVDLDYTPAQDATATETILYRVCDTTNTCANQSITIEIQALNDVPRVSPLSFNTSEDTVLTIADSEVLAQSTDVEGSAMFVSWGLASAGSVSDEGDSITYTPEANAAGTVDLPATVCDSDGGCTTVVAKIEVGAVNDAPVLQPIDDVSTTIGATVSIQPVATDIDTNDLTYQATGLPQGLSINTSTGTISGTVANPQPSASASVTVSVSDGAATVSDTFVIRIDSQLLVDPVTPLTVPEDSAGQGQLSGRTDYGNVTFSVAVPPTNGTISDLTASTTNLSPHNLDTFEATYTYTPTPDFNGADSVKLTVCDAETGLQCVTTTVPLTITPVNDAPALDAVADQPIAGGRDYLMTVVGSDPDGDTLTFSATDLPTGLTINASNGRISGTPEAGNEEQTKTSTITVTDNGTPSLSRSVTANFIYDEHSVAAEAGKLVITEVMYAESSSSRLDEFVELTNIGTSPINIQAFQLADFDPTDGAGASSQGFSASFPATDAHGSQSIVQPGQSVVIWITDPTTGGLLGLPYSYTATTADLEFTLNLPTPRLHPAGDEIWLAKGSELVGFAAWGSDDDFATNHRGDSPSTTTGLWIGTKEQDLASVASGTSISLAANAGWPDSACWEHTGTGAAISNGCTGANTTIDTDPGTGARSPGLRNYN